MMYRPEYSTTKTLIWHSVDLLKAGTGSFSGEAAATIKNLVSERVQGIQVADQEAYFDEARVRLKGLGAFVLRDEMQIAYFHDQVDNLISRVEASIQPSTHSQLPS